MDARRRISRLGGKSLEALSKRLQRTLLILGRFRVHEKPELRKLLEECGTDVVFVPAGLTFFCQPLDAYVNGPLKRNIRRHWEQNMISQNNTKGFFFEKADILILLEKFEEVSKEELLRWVKTSLESIKIEGQVFLDIIYRDYNELRNAEEKHSREAEQVQEISGGLEDLILEDELEYMNLE